MGACAPERIGFVDRCHSGRPENCRAVQEVRKYSETFPGIDRIAFPDIGEIFFCRVARPVARHGAGRVEDGRGSWGPMAIAPFSHPRSSNRTCGATASGSPTGFTARHTTVQVMAGVQGAEVHVPHRRFHRRTVWSRVLPLCAVWRGSRSRARRRIGRHH